MWLQISCPKQLQVPSKLFQPSSFTHFQIDLKNKLSKSSGAGQPCQSSTLENKKRLALETSEARGGKRGFRVGPEVEATGTGAIPSDEAWAVEANSMEVLLVGPSSLAVLAKAWYTWTFLQGFEAATPLEFPRLQRGRC